MTTNNGELLLECFDSIVEFNEIGGNQAGVVDPSLEAKMLKEEIKEYFEAAMQDDHKEVLDGQGDIMVVLVGTIWKHNNWARFPEVLKAICDSNMSKFCSTLDEAKATVEHYKENLDIEARYEFNEKYNKYVIKNKQGKILKSINFRKPVINA